MTAFDVETDVGRLHVAEIGSGPPAVLWHSMFVDSRSWERLIPELSATRTLYVIDAPAAGRSGPMRQASDIAGCARAAQEVLDTIHQRAGDGPVDWIGSAWGGHVGLQLASTAPHLIRTLVAISAPTHPIDDALRRRIRMLIPLYRIIGARGPIRSTIEAALFTDHTRASDPDAIAMLRDSLAHSGRAMVPAIRTAILNRVDLGEASRTIGLPVLFIATDDRGEWTAEEAERAAAVMVDARVATVHGARVIPALEQPAATAAAISAFWLELADRAAPDAHVGD